MSGFELGEVDDTVSVVWHGNGIRAEALPRVTPEGRVRFVEMRVKKDAPDELLTSDDLRGVPFTGMLTWAHEPKALRSILRSAGWDDEGIRRVLRRMSMQLHPSWSPKKPSLRFKIPEGRRKPDAFYGRVARVYTWLSIWGGTRAPAAEIAEANKVPVTTVHRWIKEARRRGLLPPGQIGRAGA
jgi:hypothetical protein